MPDETQTRPLILASASPRRRELLGRLRLPFIARPTDVDEIALEAAFDGPPEDLALHLARHKAAAGLTALSAEESAANAVIIAADTTVLLDGSILGKPRDADEAWEMLRRLRGRAHVVRTGVVVQPATGAAVSAAVSTRVVMRPFSDDEIARYIASGDPFDKAGSYAIQHPVFQPVEQIDGCATNVIGLPICQLARLLRGLGMAVPTPAPLPNGCEWDARCRPAND